MGSLFDKGGAAFNADRRYRYHLWRHEAAIGSQSLLRVVWIMVNPSSADESNDDPTMQSVVRISRAWGFCRLHVVNLFALRSPNVEDLLADPDPIGGEANDRHILRAALDSRRVVLAWGSHAKVRALIGQRAPHVLSIVRDATRQRAAAGRDHDVGVLGINSDGSPKHPLFLPKTTAFQPIDPARFAC